MLKGTRTGLFLYFMAIVMLSSCGTPTPAAELQEVSVYTTSAAAPWLADMYECAESVAVIRLTDSPSDADIRLQVGESKYLSSFAYQVDEEEILVVTHRQSPIQNLTVDEAQALFAGLGDPSVQVWVYAPEEDIFEVFDQFVMKGRSVSSSAQVAIDPQQMSDVLNAESTAVGILSRHWKAGNVRELLSVATVPVLAIAQSEPQGAVNQLVGCLQK
jgi:hypothetical protein